MEVRAVAALEKGDREALRALAAEFRKLAPEVRRNMPLRIRDDSVEFTFRGKFPGDQSPWQMLEYLVSGAEKEYESLLVAPYCELKRLQGFRPIFARHAGDGRRMWSARLVWTEAGAPRSVDLTDLLSLLEPKEQKRFLDHLGILKHGFGGEINVAADPSFLPRRRVDALLLLTIQITPGK
jgi:hypothetical protein